MKGARADVSSTPSGLEVDIWATDPAGGVDRRETERLLEVIRQARATGELVALATVVRVKGSAYRREGTRMLVRRDGTYECSLSGGCLEPTVAEAAARVITTGAPVVVSYDLADDSLWGLGIGCSGAVEWISRSTLRNRVFGEPALRRACGFSNFSFSRK